MLQPRMAILLGFFFSFCPLRAHIWLSNTSSFWCHYSSAACRLPRGRAFGAIFSFCLEIASTLFRDLLASSKLQQQPACLTANRPIRAEIINILITWVFFVLFVCFFALTFYIIKSNVPEIHISSLKKKKSYNLVMFQDHWQDVTNYQWSQ